MTYREIAVNRLISIGIQNRFEAERIVELIENEGEFAPQVFRDFKENINDDWDVEAELNDKEETCEK